MRVAIIGSGIAGLATAHLLYRNHEISLFESDSRIGGHVHTVKVNGKHDTVDVDTGFIVYNERNYPNFVKLIQELDIETQPSSMSFSVRITNPDLEYNGSTLRQLFVDKRNLFRPWFYKMLRDILRFNRMAPDAIDAAQRIGHYANSWMSTGSANLLSNTISSLWVLRFGRLR